LKVQKYLAYVYECAVGLLLLTWFYLPLIVPDFWFSGLNLAQIMSPNNIDGLANALYSSLSIVVMIIGFWKIISLFLTKALPKLTAYNQLLPLSLNLLASSIILVLQFIHAFTLAHTFSYFTQIPVLWYVLLGLTVLVNAYSIIQLIQLFNQLNPSYKDYLNYKNNLKEHTNILSKVKSWGIQKRLVVSFVFVVFLIVAVLSTVLLRDFGDTINSSVRENGLALAQRAASTIKAAFSDNITIMDYFDEEARKNSSATFPFKVINFVSKDPKSDSFSIKYSTNAEELNTLPDPLFTDIVSDQSKVLEDKNLSLFLAPVILSQKNLGYVAVEYDQDVIMGPWHRTQVKVFLIGIIFIYLTIFIVYLFGRNIVIPILFLRMSVNVIAETPWCSNCPPCCLRGRPVRAASAPIPN